jgi:hypothetical protein
MNTDIPTKEDMITGGSDYDYDSPQYDVFLTELFKFGTMSEKTYNIAKNLDVTLRPLIPSEDVIVARYVDKEPGNLSKIKTLKLETLSRAIVKVNGQLLRFAEANKFEWQDIVGVDKTRNPSEIEQQRFYLRHKLNSTLIDLVYDKYEELLQEQKNLFVELKKK